MPPRIVVRGTPIMIRSIPRSETGSAFGWYHFSRQEAQLYRGLTGGDLAILALHEITHAVRHVYAIKQRDQRPRTASEHIEQLGGQAAPRASLGLPLQTGGRRSSSAR